MKGIALAGTVGLYVISLISLSLSTLPSPHHHCSTASISQLTTYIEYAGHAAHAHHHASTTQHHAAPRSTPSHNPSSPLLSFHHTLLISSHLSFHLSLIFHHRKALGKVAHFSGLLDSFSSSSKNVTLFKLGDWVCSSPPSLPPSPNLSSPLLSSLCIFVYFSLL